MHIYGEVKATKHHNRTEETLIIKRQINLIDKSCDTVYKKKFVNFSSKGVDWPPTSRCNCQSEHLVWKLVRTHTGLLSVDLTLFSAVQCVWMSTCPFFFVTIFPKKQIKGKGGDDVITPILWIKWGKRTKCWEWGLMEVDLASVLVCCSGLEVFSVSVCLFMPWR